MINTLSLLVTSIAVLCLLSSSLCALCRLEFFNSELLQDVLIKLHYIFSFAWFINNLWYVNEFFIIRKENNKTCIVLFEQCNKSRLRKDIAIKRRSLYGEYILISKCCYTTYC